MLTWGKAVDALTIRGASPVVTQCGSANSDDLLSRSGGVRTGIPVASGDGKVHARLNDFVNCIVQSLGYSATQRHVSDGTLVPCLPGGSKLSGLLSGLQNTADNINHSATSARTGNGVGSLSDPIFVGTGAMGAMAIAILIDVVLRDGVSPGARPPNSV